MYAAIYLILYLVITEYTFLEYESDSYRSHCMLRFDPWIIPSSCPKEAESLDRYLAKPLSLLNMAERTYYYFQHLYATCVDTLLWDPPSIASSYRYRSQYRRNNTDVIYRDVFFLSEKPTLHLNYTKDAAFNKTVDRSRFCHAVA